MKLYKYALIFVCFFINDLFADEIKIIELHEKKPEDTKQESNQDILFSNDNIEDLSVDESVDEGESDESSIDAAEKEDTKNNEIVRIEGYWEHSNKYDLDFLFNNFTKSNSKVINSFFINTLTEFSKSPESYEQAEFDNLRIKTLIKMGQKEKAIKVLNNIQTYESYKNYYDRIKLDSYLTSNQLIEVCSFKDTLKDLNEIQNNAILKISIFCSFLENKFEEADFLNSLLLDTEDNDEYFQKIYYNIKNEINDPIDITTLSYDESSFALYSAMLRISSLPFTENFLEIDSTNLILPIVLSTNTDISLRLKSAHKAYEQGLLNAESLSALYQSVDFSSDQLNNWKQILKSLNTKNEVGMALLFQSARVQLLPITRLESLKEFWEYANNNNFEKLAYDVSRDLIHSIEPSIELSEYSILIARAHIFNKNFDKASKWIAFFENYALEEDESNKIKLENIKLLYNLQQIENKDTFIENLKNDIFLKIQKNENLEGYSENIKTIFSIILNDKDQIYKINDDQKIIDQRTLPSNYIINNINYSAENNKIGELILTVIVSLNNKSWDDIHPLHLKILLESLKKANLNNLFIEIITEIFEESKII